MALLKRSRTLLSILIRLNIMPLTKRKPWRKLKANKPTRSADIFTS